MACRCRGSQHWPGSGADLLAATRPATMRADGHQVSTSTVERALRRRGLLLPSGFRADRRSWSRLRTRVFRDPPTERNRVWQMDFSEFETPAAGSGGSAPLSTTRASTVWPPPSPNQPRSGRARLPAPCDGRGGTGPDRNTLAVEIDCFRHTYNTSRPHQPGEQVTTRFGVPLGDPYPYAEGFSCRLAQGARDGEARRDGTVQYDDRVTTLRLGGCSEEAARASALRRLGLTDRKALIAASSRSHG